MAPKVYCTSFKPGHSFQLKRKYSIATWGTANMLRRIRCGRHYILEIPSAALPVANPTLSLNDGNNDMQQDDVQTSPTDEETSQTNCDN